MEKHLNWNILSTSEAWNHPRLKPHVPSWKLKMKFEQDFCLNLWYDPISYFGKMNSTLGSVVPLAMFYVHVEVRSEEISSNSLVWHYYMWPKTPQNSTVVFVMCKNITFFACLGLGLAHMQGFRFRIGTLPLWSRILPTNEKLFKKFENGKFMSWIKNWIGSFPKYWYNDLSFGIWIGLART